MWRELKAEAKYDSTAVSSYVLHEIHLSNSPLRNQPSLLLAVMCGFCVGQIPVGLFSLPILIFDYLTTQRFFLVQRKAKKMHQHKRTSLMKCFVRNMNKDIHILRFDFKKLYWWVRGQPIWKSIQSFNQI